MIESFRDVQRANTDAERMRNEAEAYRNDIVPRARGDAARIVAAGEGDKQAAVELATGQAQQFDAVLKAYQAAKDVTLQRMYLDTMQRHPDPCAAAGGGRQAEGAAALPATEPAAARQGAAAADHRAGGTAGVTAQDSGVRALVRPVAVRRPVARLDPMTRSVIALIALLVVLLVLSDATLFTVDQTQQVLITQFGDPVRVIIQPGLHVKKPFVQDVISFDKRLLGVELPGEEVILGDQRRLIVDSFVVYRIKDPLKYYQAVGSGDFAIQGRLSSIVTGSLRRVLGNNTLLAGAVVRPRPYHGDDPE